jgi:hypothetical protein
VVQRHSAPTPRHGAPRRLGYTSTSHLYLSTFSFSFQGVWRQLQSSLASRARRSESGTEAKKSPPAASCGWTSPEQPHSVRSCRCTAAGRARRYCCRECVPREALDLLQLRTTSLPAPAPSDCYQHPPGEARRGICCINIAPASPSETEVALFS